MSILAFTPEKPPPNSNAASVARSITSVIPRSYEATRYILRAKLLMRRRETLLCGPPVHYHFRSKGETGRAANEAMDTMKRWRRVRPTSEG